MFFTTVKQPQNRGTNFFYHLDTRTNNHKINSAEHVSHILIKTHSKCTIHEEMMHEPVKFEHRLQSHPAIIKLYLFFQKFVSWKIMISKVVLEIEEFFRMEIRFLPNNARGGYNYLDLPYNFHFSWRHAFFVFCHDSSMK